MSVTNYDLLLQRKVRERLEQIASEESGQIVAGISKGDQFDYGKRCGRVRGILDAIDIIEETAKALMGEDRKEQN